MIDWDQEDDDDQLLPLVEELSRNPESEIMEFDNILAEKLYELDGKEYAKNIDPEFAYGNPEGYFSMDLFLYTRCCVVANGKGFYENVLQNPTKMPKGYDYEPLLEVGFSSFHLKTKKSFDEYLDNRQMSVSWETYSNKSKW
ncbi:hypothetical protein AVL50_19765 [Flammeovirga sp. SJP92]|nr:hypothetical protein AVL50_19765 [Flammeovirga sp. SJP92]